MQTRKQRITEREVDIKRAKEYIEPKLYPYKASDYFKMPPNSGADFTIYTRNKLTKIDIYIHFDKYPSLKDYEKRW
jgi:hypothetical protein